MHSLSRGLLQVEMPIHRLLSQMELCGVGFFSDELEFFKRSISERLADLQVCNLPKLRIIRISQLNLFFRVLYIKVKAYHHAGREFSISSLDEGKATSPC
jgi:hypothetical protein